MKSFEFEVVSIDDARRGLEDELQQNAEYARTGQRPQDPGELLLEATTLWIAGLPDGVRPVELARQFPLIANGIGELWPHVARCEEYLASLVVDLRGNRKGFPLEVVQELTRLRGHYAELHPATRSARDLVDRLK